MEYKKSKMNIREWKHEQIEAAKRVLVRDDLKKLETFAGADASFFSDKCICVVVVCDKNMKIIDKQSTVSDVKCPYIKNFLFFREGEIIIETFRKLDKRPDVLMIDGNGILHPLRIGVASHIGVLLDQPTIGISKKLLCGKIEDNKIFFEREIRGAVVQTREFAKPLYVSAGHRISLDTAVETVRESMRQPHKLPEPLHIAHRLAEKIKDELQKKENESKKDI